MVRYVLALFLPRDPAPGSGEIRQPVSLYEWDDDDGNYEVGVVFEDVNHSRLEVVHVFDKNANAIIDALITLTNADIHDFFSELIDAVRRVP